MRRVEAVAVDHDGQRGVVLVDPLRLCDEQVLVPEALLPIVARFDGSKTVAEIDAELESAVGRALPRGLVADLVRQLDDRLLLSTPRFERALEAAAAGFRSQPFRAARHAGSAGYPAGPAECLRALERIAPRTTCASRSRPRGLVAPHIDLERGASGYAAAYRSLAEHEPADLYVVIGTGHQGPSAPLTGLCLDWDTPAGRLPTDVGFVRDVHRQLGGPHDLDLYLHRDEHSVEFQMLFLAHLLAGRPARVAGFLTGSAPEPATRARVVEALREAARPRGQVCWVAGADLAHLGPRFGDPDRVDDSRLARLADDERGHLAHLERGDPDAFYASIEGRGNPDRVCGTAPIHLVASLAGGPGELLHYGQARAADGSQVVSFCALRF
jgi:AmmeMemoRadiSam system protein B